MPRQFNREIGQGTMRMATSFMLNFERGHPEWRKKMRTSVDISRTKPIADCVPDLHTVTEWSSPSSRFNGAHQKWRSPGTAEHGPSAFPCNCSQLDCQGDYAPEHVRPPCSRRQNDYRAVVMGVVESTVALQRHRVATDMVETLLRRRSPSSKGSPRKPALSVRS